MIAKHLAAKAQEAYVMERGSGAERHTRLIVKRRAAKVREAYVIERRARVGGRDAYEFDRKTPGG